MELNLIEHQGVKITAGPPAQPLMTRADDVNRLLEACWSNGTHTLLLHVENLTPAFFDLSSGEAGSILQKLQNYHIRLAVVRPPESGELSQRFRELMVEEERRREFGLFPTREEALAWLTT
jgi:hypothetical protein